MKKISLAISFIFIFTLVSAQPNVSVVQLSKTAKAKFIGYSKLGKLYALPQDNMPCIVPPAVTVALMPVGGNISLAGSYIPNAVPKQDLIAANTTANNFFKFYKAPQQPSKNLMLDLVRKK